MKKPLHQHLTEPINLISLLLIFIFPFALVVYQLIAEIDIKIEFTQKEKLGLAYNYPLKNLLVAVIEHRTQVNQYLNGDKSLAPAIATATEKIETAIQNLNAVEKQLSPQFRTSPQWLALKTSINGNWQRLKKQKLNLSPTQSWQAHTTLVNDILDLIAHIGDVSNLILDPSLDSYYLMDTVVTQLPLTIENTAQAKDIGAKIAAQQAQQKIADSQKAKLLIIRSLIAPPIQSVERGLQISANANPQVQRQLSTKMRENFKDIKRFIDLLDKDLINANSINLQPLVYIATAETALESQLKLYDTAFPLLDRLLEQRLNQLVGRKYQIIGFALLVLAVVTYVFIALVSNRKKRQQFEKELQAAEAKYRSIFNNSINGIFQITPAGEYLSANPALAEIYGYNSPGEFISN